MAGRPLRRAKRAQLQAGGVAVKAPPASNAGAVGSDSHIDGHPGDAALQALATAVQRGKDTSAALLDAGWQVHQGEGWCETDTARPERETEGVGTATLAERETLCVNLTQSVSAEVMAAVYRAACWPCFEEAFGYAETTRAESATVIGHTVNCDKIVNVCIPGRQGGNWVKILVPKMTEVKVYEDGA